MMKSIELFAGAGGLGIGLHEAGFKPVNVIEWDSYCCDTIRENKTRGMKAVRNWKVTEGDVRAVDFKEYEGKVRLVSGGPPCQPFSMGGKHGAYDDARDMFPQAIRAVREAKPQAFMFENVKGLTRASFRNYFEYIRLQLEHPEIKSRRGEEWADHLARLEQHHTSGSRSGLNYRVVTQLVNSADYGVPQRRERVSSWAFARIWKSVGIFHFPPIPRRHFYGIKLSAAIGIVIKSRKKIGLNINQSHRLASQQQGCCHGVRRVMPLWGCLIPNSTPRRARSI
jgi:DNA (cytosine-5)-methyltransferase 1